MGWPLVSTFWLGSQVLSLYLYFAQLLYEHARPALKNAHTLVQGTEIFSRKFSVKTVLMLDNPFLVPSFYKLNHISLCFVQIITKSAYSLQSNVFFWSHPRYFGPLGKFQRNIKISIKTARVSRLRRIRRVPCIFKHYSLETLGWTENKVQERAQ